MVRWCFMLGSRLDESEGEVMRDIKETQVIGNIHEHKHLLENDDD